ncbi:acyl carrier protein [Jiella endophytica]|uniref:Acyl carrier protein n=1 Tax=Jiella endophytica TaxID=2558362 RepID=A0A4Y8RE06_9HYPH|nr:acyl carrier protein [Jiella endophytica]TFF20536.1 acyl carrier protein [Jiella endophytica]
MSADIADKICAVIARHLAIERDEVSEGARLVETLGADSLDIVELAIELEEEFGVELKDEAVEHIVTVSDVVTAVEDAIARRAA